MQGVHCPIKLPYSLQGVQFNFNIPCNVSCQASLFQEGCPIKPSYYLQVDLSIFHIICRVSNQTFIFSVGYPIKLPYSLQGVLSNFHIICRVSYQTSILSVGCSIKLQYYLQGVKDSEPTVNDFCKPSLQFSIFGTQPNTAVKFVLSVKCSIRCFQGKVNCA